MEGPRAILFDWDNTLVDAWPGVTQALAETFSAFGLRPWSIAEVRGRVRRSLRDTFPDLFGEAWERARDIFYEALERSHLQHVTPLPGAAQTLERARDLGLPLAVVSNKTGRYLRREAEALGWSRHFAALIGAGDAEADKPDPAPFRLALAAIGAAATDAIWYVGDTALDMQAARRSGLLPVLIGDAAHDGGAEATGYALRFADHRDLADRLLRLVPR
ncbi:MAG: HAD family hydrolase [Acetobacteraceae bacterium]|nr:HAD family hydrolase [Acetobacteraceae bacterium]